MRKVLQTFALLLFAGGCASATQMLGGGKLSVPPEFNQKVILEVGDDYQMYQAPKSGYDVGDLQSFHTQHTFPITVEETFREIFGQVQMAEKGPKIETNDPDVPAIFEVKMVDLAHDTYMEADSYRSQLTLAVAMKSPRGNIFWQKAFRGDGLVHVDPQFSTGLGPQDAVVDALRDALGQMQDAIINSPEVRAQMRYYKGIQDERKEKDAKLELTQPTPKQ